MAHPYDTSYGAPPPGKILILFNLFFRPSYDLKAGKKCTVRARLRAGGERPPTGLATPRLRTGCVVFACHRTRGPLWAEWTIPRAYARAEVGGPGGGWAQPCRLILFGIYWNVLRMGKGTTDGPEYIRHAWGSLYELHQ